ncbi:MAG: hypothetical protein ACNYPE_01625 [Candidatus Azotimanducaceae bacterium WSBS_2022_MAG_OTU7]
MLVLRGSDDVLAVDADHLLQTLLAEFSPSESGISRSEGDREISRSIFTTVPWC